MPPRWGSRFAIAASGHAEPGAAVDRVTFLDELRQSGVAGAEPVEDLVGRLPETGRKFDRWLDLVLMQRLVS